MNRILNENREWALAKLKADQKDFVFTVMADAHGLDSEECRWWWKEDQSSGVEYYDLARIEDELAINKEQKKRR